jgi:hypothetical protein
MNPSLFPHFSAEFTSAMADTPILVNGMRVIFDQPVTVHPVNLKQKEAREYDEHARKA